MMDTQSPTSSSSDDRTAATDESGRPYNQPIDGHDNLTPSVDKALEAGIASAEQKLDTFLSDLDKFLNKF